MDSTQNWRALFENWPDEIERQGTVVTKLGEATPFVNFLMAGHLVLLERTGPDAHGARKAVMAFEEIALMRLNSPLPLDEFKSMGFKTPEDSRKLSARARSAGRPGARPASGTTRPASGTTRPDSTTTRAPAGSEAGKPIARPAPLPPATGPSSSPNTASHDS